MGSDVNTRSQQLGKPEDAALMNESHTQEAQSIKRSRRRNKKREIEI